MYIYFEIAVVNRIFALLYFEHTLIMSTTKELLEKLDGKVVNLLSKVKEAKAAEEKKAIEVDSLKNQLAAQEKELEAVKAENEKLKNADNGEEKEEIKFKISEMVKEIDKCISLLKV